MDGYAVIRQFDRHCRGDRCVDLDELRLLKDMIAGAKTLADHKAIANYYYAEAAKASANAEKRREQMAQDYREWYRTAGKGWSKDSYAPGTVEHCEGLVKDYKAAAGELTPSAVEAQSHDECSPNCCTVSPQGPGPVGTVPAQTASEPTAFAFAITCSAMLRPSASPA